MSNVKIAQLESFFNEGNSFVDLLPYFDYQPFSSAARGGAYVLSDGSFGQVWELSMIESELRDEGVLTHFSEQIEGLAARLPSDQVSCQFILLSGDKVESKLQPYTDFKESAAGARPEIIDSCFSGKVSHCLSRKEGFFKHQNMVFAPKEIKVLFTIRFFPNWRRQEIFEKFLFSINAGKSLKNRIDAEFNNSLNQFEKTIDITEGVFSACGIKFTRIAEESLAQILYTILNPRRSEIIPQVAFRPQEYLRDQVLYNAPEFTGKGFIFEDRHTRVVSLKELPYETQPGMFTREIIRGIRFCLLDYLKRFIFVVNFTVPSSLDALARIKLQKGFAFMQRFTFMGDRSVEAMEKKDELDTVIKETFAAGKRIVYPSFYFIAVEDSAEQAETAADNILTVLNRLGCEGLKEEIIAASLFLQCLPLCFNHTHDRFVRRAKRMLSSNFVDMLPLYGSFQGTKTPAQMYYNRRGEPVFFDFFDSNINCHGIAVGASGAGKSFWMNSLILDQTRLDAHFFIIDKGDSYKKLCEALGGQYIRFELNSPLTINPFARFPDAEYLAFLMTVLTTMASGGDERDRLVKEEEGLLQKAVLEAYEKNKVSHKEVTLSDVTGILKSSQFNDGLYGEKIGQRLALKLSPFVKGGQYGAFFDGPNTFDFSGQFTVFELANLSSYKDLQLVVLLNLIFFITNFVFLPEMKPKRKFLVIDEAWSLLKMKNTAAFIEESFRTFRKSRCSVIAVTQELNDLISQESGKAIISNAANKIFLKQEAGIVDSLKEKIGLSEDAIKMIKSLEMIKGKFSEALVMTDTAAGVIRLVPDPFLYWVANSETKENQFLRERIAEHKGNITAALNACVKEAPYGFTNI